MAGLAKFLTHVVAHLPLLVGTVDDNLDVHREIHAALRRNALGSAT